MAQRNMHIKRPMNCFMLWSREKRCEILKKNPGINNAVISKMLGEAWRKLSDKEKKPYVKEAKRLTAKLLEDHPDYKYRPRRRKAKTPEPRKTNTKPDTSTTIPFSPAAIHSTCYSQPAQIIHSEGFWPKYPGTYSKSCSENDPLKATLCLSPSAVCNPVRTAFPFRALPNYGYYMFEQDMLSSPYYVNWCNPRSTWIQNQI